MDERPPPHAWPRQARYDGPPDLEHLPKFTKKVYEAELQRLHHELAKFQSWVRATGQRIAIVFEGRDAAGKGGTIKRLIEPLNARIVRVVALPAPTERERGEWYFQRYVQHLPAAGEIVIFDRSWYNRAGVERVMGFATPEQVERFLDDAPVFEQLLTRDGLHLVKYWFSVSAHVQEKRLHDRIQHPAKRWKISDVDLASRAKWDEYSEAKDAMFDRTDTDHAPWYVVESDDKKRARLNCIHHLLSLFPYESHIREPMVLPEIVADPEDERPHYVTQRIVPRVY